MRQLQIWVVGLTMMLAAGNLRLLAQSTRSPEGSWLCHSEQGSYHVKSSLRIRPTGLDRWEVQSVILEANSPAVSLMVGQPHVSSIYPAGPNRFQPVTGFDGAFMTLDESGMHWQFERNGRIQKDSLFFGDCIRTSVAPGTGGQGLPSMAGPATPGSTGEIPHMQPPPGYMHGPPDTPLGGADSPGASLGDQITNEKNHLDVCGKRIIVTVFGYFEYDQEVDLTQGAKSLTLKFEPFAFDASGPSGQAAAAGVSIKPTLKIADSSITSDPPDQPERPLGGPVHWEWKLSQKYWSSVQDTNGNIAIDITSAQGAQGPLLSLKVTGKPWWWPATWIWKNILARPEVSFALLVFLVITWKRGPRKAFSWLWLRIKRTGSGGK
ncbi:MAG TPA: hypothetical protein VI685_19630 [Candidatus Angelobacter sp.]